MAADTSRVEIGFLDEVASWKLESRFFPSKVGGKPAWLDLKNIDVDVSCGSCSKPCVFLCQLYAPVTELNETYHRSIFVFVCKNPDCSVSNDNKNFKVYRCQLGRENEFYSASEPEERPEWSADVKIENYSRTCVVCGCFGPNQCGKCKRTKYCSREHQLIDWKSGHNVKCGSTDSSSADILFPEYEIVCESELVDDEDAEMLEKANSKTDEERLKEYEEYVSKFEGGTLGNVDHKLMEEFAFGKEDKYFRKFKERLKISPDQVVRYDRGGEPLWITKPNLKREDVPNCQICNSRRVFEFQILPTLLNSLNVDRLEKSLDWGVLLVYTCRNNCQGTSSYKQEFLWKQDITE